MKYYLKILVVSISLLSSNLGATTFAPHLTERPASGKYHTNGVEPVGTMYSENTKLRSTEMMVSAMAFSTTNSTTVECNAREIADLPDSALVEYLTSNPATCTGHLFGGTGGYTVYSDTRYELVTAAIVAASNNYDSQNENVRRLVRYLRAYRFNAFYHPDSFPVSDRMRAAEQSAINAFFDNVRLSSHATAEHYWNVSEIALYADASERVWLYHDYIYRTLQEVDGAALVAGNAAEYGWAVFGALSAVSRAMLNHADTFEPYVLSTAGLPTLLRKIATDSQFRSLDMNNAKNAANTLTLLLTYESMHASVTSEVDIALSIIPKFDESWFPIVTNVNYYAPELCSTLTVNVCDTPELRAEVTNKAFPNVFEYDEGKLIIHTPLSRDRVNQLVNQLNEVKSTFFNLTGQTTPVADDPNDVVQLYVYGSPADYRAFQPFLFDLDVNNGGIYIEPWGSMFTFDREVWESSLTLDELVRHEYGHYLASRYLIPGFWGQTEMYTTDAGGERLTWFDEGIANVVAGGTQYQDINVLWSVINPLSGMSDLPTTRDTVNATYSNSMIYQYGSIILNYLIDSKSPLLTELFSSLRNDSVVDFENVRESISQLNTAAFHTYITDQANDADSIVVPWLDTIYPSARFLQHSTAAAIQSEYSQVLGNSVLCTEPSSFEFMCEIDVELTGSTQFSIMPQANAITEKLVMSNVSLNVSSSNCYADDRIVRCVGALRPSSVAFEEFPEFIVPDVVYDGENGTTYRGKLTSSFDGLGMPVKFSWVSWPKEGNVYVKETGEFEFVFDSNHSLPELSFTYKAESGFGLVSNIGTVTFKLESVPAPTATNVSIEVTKGNKATGTMKGDGHGSAITYEVLDISSLKNGTFTYDSNTGAFEYSSDNTYVGNIQLQYFVRNSYGTESNISTITLAIKDTSVKPEQPASEEKSGGSLSSFVIFLTIILLLRTQVRSSRKLT